MGGVRRITNWPKLNASHLWRCLAALWEVPQLGLKWKIEYGQHTRFWTDNWVGDRGPLHHLTFAPLTESDLQKPLNQFVTSDGQWKWSDFDKLLPQDILKQIAELQPPNGTVSPDKCYWHLNGNGTFTVQSACHLLMPDNWNDDSSL